MAPAFLTSQEVQELTGYVKSLGLLAAARRPWNDPDHVFGVYFLFSGELLQYVGQSIDIFTRVEQHRYPAPPSLIEADWFDSISTIEVSERDLLDPVECYYIHSLKPPRNIKYPRPGRLARMLLNG